MTIAQKKAFSTLIKITIVVAALWFVYNKVISHKDLKEFLELLRNTPPLQAISVLGSVLLLMLLNWSLEALKWRKLIERVEQISIWRSIESVFCGLTLAIFTPNRLGEYGGRVFFLSPKRRITGVVAMGVGNIAQWVLVNLFGLISGCVFLYRFIPIEPILRTVIFIVVSSFLAFCIIFYFNVQWLSGLLRSIKYTRKYKKFYSILARYRKVELLNIFLLCIARYTVSITQYILMFLWLAPNVGVANVLMVVPILFFVQTTLPSLDLIDVGVRSLTAVFLFKYVTSQSTAVVACTASIWLINIIIPAILGSYFVFKLNFFGNTQRN